MVKRKQIAGALYFGLILALIAWNNPRLLGLGPPPVFERYRYPALPAPVGFGAVDCEPPADADVVQYRVDPARQGFVLAGAESKKRRATLLRAPLNIGVHGASKGSPVADATGIYVGADSGWIFAFDPDGKPRWRYQVDNSENGVHGTPALDKTGVYIGAYNGVLYRLRKSDGRLDWAIKLGDAIGASPLLADGALYISVETLGRSNGFVAKLDPCSGKLLWRTDWLGAHVHSSPTFDRENNRVLAGANNNFVYSIDAESGTVTWEYDAGGDVKGTVTAVGNTVYFASWGKKLTALRAVDGLRMWETPLGDESQSSVTYLPAEDFLVVGANDGKTRAFRRSDGRPVWEFATGNRRHRGSALAVCTEKACVAWMACGKAICAHEGATGRVRERHEVGEILTGEVFGRGGAFYLSLDGDGGLWSLQ